MKTLKLSLIVSCMVGLLLLSSCVKNTPKIPTAPSDVTATPGPGYMTVTWKDNSDNETGFALYRDGGSSALEKQEATKIKDLAANTTSFVDTDVALETSYSYSVVATGGEGNSKQVATKATATIAQGVDLLVGTNNRRYDPDSNGTIFVVYLLFPETVLKDANTAMNIKITGPAGWNGGKTETYSLAASGFARNNGYEFNSFGEIDAVAGVYQLEVTVGGKLYKASGELKDPSFKFPRATNIQVTSSSKTSVTATWDAVADAKSYWVALWRSNFEDKPIVNYTKAKDTTITFNGLNLEDDIYHVEVAAQNVDVVGRPIKVEPFGLSYDTKSFAIGNNPPCSSNDQVIPIPDVALQKAIRDMLGKPTGDLTCLDMALLTDIGEDEGREKGIGSLEGLQYAINLEFAQLGENSISDLSPLANLKKIEFLNLNNNQISDLRPLQNLTTLRELYICCDSNTYTDISPLANLTNLEQLDIGGHVLGDISVLADFDNLIRLWTWSNNLENSDLTVLEGKDLLYLEVSGNNLSDLGFLSDFPNLEAVHIGYNPITDLSPLIARTQLEDVDLRGLDLSNISFLESFTELFYLDLGDNLISDITPLVENTGLGEGDFVNLDGNVLDVTDGSDDKADIDALIARGVDVSFEDQKAPQ